MQELAQAMSDYERTLDSDILIAAAKKWACFCLENHKHDLLRRGLEVSMALVAYDAGVRDPNDLSK